MKCAEVRTLIVGREERPLTPAESTAIRCHLAACERCRDFEAVGTLDLSGLLPEAPLTGADYTRIRARVREAARDDGRTPLALRFALAILATVLLATAGWLASRPSSPGTTAPSHPVAAGEPERQDVAGNPAPTSRPEQAAVQADVAARPARPAAIRRRPGPAATPSPSPAPAVALADTSPGPQDPPIVIEIHTADPDIRILWIAGSEPADNPTTSMEE